VFVDGDFWHGRDWESRRAKLAEGANPGYWIPKIESNMARDIANTERLEDSGFMVLRFWETDIRKNVEAVASTIEGHIAARK